MIKKVILATALCSTLLFSFTYKNAQSTSPLTTDAVETIQSTTVLPDVFLLDAKKCKITWVGKGVGKQHNGTIDISTGSISVDTKQIKSLYTFIDMKTIKCLDIKDEGFAKQLTDHLKGPDLFNIPKYPKAEFKLTKATRLDVPEGQVNYTDRKSVV